MRDQTASPAGVVLTREELTLVTRAAGSSELPGVGTETPEQIADANNVLGPAYAERSLRARGMASLDDDGQVTIDPALARLVTTCTNARQALWLFRMSPGVTTRQAFGYIGDEGVVLHTKPEPALHELTPLPGPAELIDRLIALAGCTDDSPHGGRPSVLSTEVLTRAREIAEARDVSGAAAELLSGGMDGDAAEAIATTLAEAHGVAVFVHLTPLADGGFDRKEITVLSGARGSWVMTQDPDDASAAASLEQVGREDLDALLNGWLDGRSARHAVGHEVTA